ncbi:MAG: DUF1573 domain-containing protein [Phycisphaerae bacterium]
MRRACSIGYTVISLILLLGAGLLSAQSAATPAPTTTTAPAESIPLTYTLTNPGTVPLRLLRVETDCVCAGKVTFPAVIAPGDSGVITATFIPGEREGRQVVPLKVFTDDPKQPLRQEQVSITLPTLANIIPRLLFWQIADGLTAKTMDVLMQLPEANLSAISLPDGWQAQWQALPGPARGYRVTVTPSATTPASATGTLWFVTTEGKRIGRSFVVRRSVATTRPA